MPYSVILKCCSVVNAKLMYECWAHIEAGVVKQEKKVNFVISLHANRLLINNFMFSCTNIKCFLRAFIFAKTEIAKRIDRRI